ncbi:hypothetical protein [Staphylococcus phage vB_SauH_DELF3]|nr:hypothetical protein [Staphylococcus phage vB_SauH_DELF3]
MQLPFGKFAKLNMKTGVSEGMYSFRGAPFYYIEHVQDETYEYASLYNKHSVDDEVRQKKYKIGTVSKTSRGGNILNAAIKSMLPNNKKYHKVYAPPIFLANLIRLGTDMTEAAVGKGSFEREKHRVTITQKEVAGVIHGEDTGVFICLQNPKWIKLYTPLDCILQYYQRIKGYRINV